MNNVKPVLDHPGYVVSDDGRVFSDNRGVAFRKELRTEPTRDGYLRVNLFVPGSSPKRYRWSAVAPIVAGAFIGPRPAGLQVRHLDGDKTNNTAGNLAYGTAKENAKDRDLHGTTVRGERSRQARHTDVEVADAVARVAAGESAREVAASIGVSKTALNDWRAGRSRKTVALWIGDAA